MFILDDLWFIWFLATRMLIMCVRPECPHQFRLWQCPRAHTSAPENINVFANFIVIYAFYDLASNIEYWTRVPVFLILGVSTAINSTERRAGL